MIAQRRSAVCGTASKQGVMLQQHKETSVRFKPQGSRAPRDIELELAEQTLQFRANTLPTTVQTWKEWGDGSELCPNSLELLPVLVTTRISRATVGSSPEF